MVSPMQWSNETGDRHFEPECIHHDKGNIICIYILGNLSRFCLSLLLILNIS